MDVAYRGLKDTSACFCFVDSSLALNDINEACFDKRWQSDSVASQNDDVLFQRSRRGPQAGKMSGKQPGYWYGGITLRSGKKSWASLLRR